MSISAGIGRTGTFCTLDSILTELSNNSEINSNLDDLVFQTVLNFRKQRVRMVENRVYL